MNDCKPKNSIIFVTVFLLIASISVSLYGGQQKQVAVTIDDVPYVSKATRDIAGQIIKTQQLLKTISAHNIPAVGFVNAGKLFPGGKKNQGKIDMLQMWLDAGLELGNHTYGHKDLHKVSWDEFKEDIIKGETIVKEVVQKKGKKFRYFRHPFLHTGRSLEIKQKCEAFLKNRGYTVAPVTHDNSEWMYARAYDNAILKGDAQLQKRIVESYISYMESKFEYFERQSKELFGYHIHKVLLLHSNNLNADHLEKLVLMLKKRGYRFISLGEALKDKAYSSADTYTGPGGITWLHRWAITMGKKGAFFKGEPEVPEFIKKAASARYE